MPARRILIVRLPCRKVFPTGPLYLLSAIHHASPDLPLRFLDLALEEPHHCAGVLARAIQEFAPDLVAFSWRDIQIFSPQDLDGALRDAFVAFHHPSPLRKAGAALHGLHDMAVYRSALSRTIRILRKTVRAFPGMPFALGGPSIRIFGEMLRGRLPATLSVFTEPGLAGFFRMLSLPPPADPLEPFMDLEAVEAAFPRWTSYQGETVGIQTKQGCPHECLFCLYGYLEGRHVRHRDPRHVVAEIEAYARRWGARRFWFADAQLLSAPRDHDHLAAILNGMVKMGLPLGWSGYLRVHELRSSLAELMVRSGLGDLEVSLNSGSQRIVDGLKLGFRVPEVLRGLETLRSCGYSGRVFLNLSLNAPGETEESLRETIDTVRRVRGIFGGDRVVPVIFFLAIQPHTGLEQEALAGGHIARGYNPLSVLPWNVLRLIYNPAPLGRLIGRACVKAFDAAAPESGWRVLSEIESSLSARRAMGRRGT